MSPLRFYMIQSHTACVLTPIRHKKNMVYECLIMLCVAIDDSILTTAGSRNEIIKYSCCCSPDESNPSQGCVL